MSEKLQLEKINLGMIQTNCYLLINKDTKETIIVDPADEAAKLIRYITELQVKPVAIILTHGHYDHIGAAKEIAKHYDVSIYAGAEEEAMLLDGSLNLSGHMGNAITVRGAKLLKDKEMLREAGFDLLVLHTPGHTKGGVCYYIEAEKVLISGDTLFHENIGRADLPTGSLSMLVSSVKRLIAELPEDTAVYPGHEQATTIGHEKQYNPYT